MASSSETSPQKADDEMPIPADSLDDDNIETARSTEIGVQADILINQMTQFDTEEWKEANKLLRQHGLPTVEMCHPSQITDIGDVVVLESSMARIVRENLISLVHDSDRRQEIIQDLIVSNNQIKNDIDKCQSNARRIEEEKRDLEILLDNAKDKMQEIEDAHLARLRQHDNTTEMLRLSRETTDRRCRHLEEKCSKQEDEINRLKKKLRMLVESEEARIERQTEVFQKYRHRSSRPHSTSDQRLLDIIDAYEGQIAKLKDDLRFYRREAEICRDASIGKRTERLDGKALLSDDSLSSDNRGLSLAGNAGRWNLDLDPSPNYKALVKSYQGQLSESRATVKDLENQVETLKLEMEARPQLKDLRKLQHKIKKLERLLAANNISVNEDSNKKTSHGSHIQDIKHMPINVCRQYLKEICVELNVSDVDDIVYQLRQPSKETEALLHLEKYLKSSLNGLATSLVPWSPPVFPASSLDKPTSVSEIRAAVDSLAVQTARVEKTKSSKEAPMHQLQSVVSHFQNLFDVPTLEGVYPRMNEIYTKLGETHNVLHTLRELLGLEENAKSTAIVNAVGEICSIHNSTTTQQLKQLLQVEDLESAIGRLQQYEDFFPAFQGVIDQLMEVLGIDRMERIVPAVRTLKLLAG
ncbi:centrosomal protein of 70 kDa-like isoform X6 [Ptychodera flava]|uniref:centrosomal protein of 70 kDa-like isoform X6 n=1 Tax=Ptychodera flava TaxID=63121 RepID=UPI00396A2ADF